MVGVVVAAWRYSGLYGGSTRGHTAVRGMIWWESWEMHGGAMDYGLGKAMYKPEGTVPLVCLWSQGMPHYPPWVV